MKFALSVLACSMLATPTWAHHSRAHYSEETVKLTGELVFVSWTFPHAGFELRVGREAGESSVWQLESWSSPYILSRMGVSEADFVVGDTVTVAGRISRRRANDFLLTHMLRDDGSEVVLVANQDSFFGAKQIGGLQQWSTDRQENVGAAEVDRGIFRVWSVEHMYAQDHFFPFADEAIRSRDGFDELDSFVVTCDPRGLPEILWENPWPFEFVDEADRIIIRYQYLNNVRTIHMSPTSNDVEPMPSRLGHSVGRWNGDTLIVNTSHINWPYFDTDGTRVTEQIRVEERFTLQPDGRSLHYRATFDDPETFQSPATHEQTWLDLGETVETDTCQAG